MGVGGQSHVPAALSQEKKPGYQSYKRLGGPHGRFGQVWKNLAHARIRTPDRQPVASRYTLSKLPILLIYFHNHPQISTLVITKTPC
jgi:hypothetical protein